MGTKEKLLAAARSCLLTRGYASTTVRDLVAESGTNQASINYHFGSKEILLNQALFDLNGEWGELIFNALTDDASSPDTDLDEARWQRIIDSIRENQLLWYLNFEAITLSQHNETIRDGLVERGRAARVTLARAFGGIAEPDTSADQVNAIGSHYYSVLVGTAMQWLIDPDTAPTAADLAANRQVPTKTAQRSHRW